MPPTLANRPLRLTTPLGPDKLLPVEFTGHETVSQPFQYQISLLAEATLKVDFDKLLGQKIAVEIDVPGGATRHFHGLCARFAAGKRDVTFARYRMTVVPQFWLLGRRSQSRIFQHLSVPDILKQVLNGLDVKWDIQGSFYPRDYCVQYRETDFAFASRLMEEEGIYYYFTHAVGGHTMVIANTPAGHAVVPGEKKIRYEEVTGGNRPAGRIVDWEKTQEIRTGKVTLWDHHFELAHQHLDAEKKLPDSVMVGKASHKLQLPGTTDALEIYDYPGGFARRFDGIDPGGGDRPKDLEEIFEDNKRTVELRMQEEQASALQIAGASACTQMTAGCKFTFEGHHDGDGDYVVTQVQHSSRLSANYRSGEGDTLTYENRFQCLPLAVPFRPARQTPKPFVRGTQTAVVVGPAGEEIFTDKYGRVKVQFHWDRQGKYDADSSCWVRVATIWAGKTWGVIHIPRIGQEVVVDFLEGDPDRPIIIGSVYNSDCPPPGNLPADKVVSGSRTASSPGSAGYNGMVCNDTKGNELVSVHSQFNMDTVVEHDQTTTVHNNRTDTIDVDDTESVGANQSCTVGANQKIHVKADQSLTVDANRTIKVGSNHTETIGSSMSITIGSTLSETVAINYSETVGAAMELTVGGLMAQSIGAAYMLSVGAIMNESVGAGKTSNIGTNFTMKVGGNVTETIGGKHGETVTGDYALKAKQISLTADNAIELKTGSASITLKSSGDIVIKGTDITIDGSGKVIAKAGGDMTLKGSKIKEN